MAYLDVAAHDVLGYVHPSIIPAPPSLSGIERTAVMLVGVDRTNPLKAPFETAVAKAGASQGRSITIRSTGIRHAAPNEVNLTCEWQLFQQCLPFP